ncbi:MAG: lipid-A-disaccharide synthase N-terminal domain-containing protein [Tepidisphaeraceae bacterium]
MSRRRYLIFGELVFLAVLGVVTVLLFRRHAPSADAVQVDVKLPDASSRVYLQRQSDGSMVYLVHHGDGRVENVPVQQMSDRLYEAGKASGAALGLSSPVVAFWLGIGLFGQVLFTGRMVVQWLASERRGKSVVPPLFWWMSLMGSLLLLSYFLWRRDPIGLLGQAFGSFIYLKNILWIRSEARQPTLAVTEGS